MSQSELEAPQSESDDTDLVLDRLLGEAQEVLGPEGLDRLLQAHERFDENVTVFGDDILLQTEEEHFKLKQLLVVTPDYVHSAVAAGFTPSQAEDTLIGLLDECPYEFVDISDSVLAAIKAFDALEADGQHFTKKTYTQFRACMALCNTNGVREGAFHALSLTTQLHIPLAESLPLIRYLPKADDHLSGYTFPVFTETLASLLHSDTDPDLIVYAFKKLAGDRPYYRLDVYTYFQEAITFGCVSAGVRPQELLAAYKAQGKDTDITVFIDAYFNKRKTDLTKYAGIELVEPSREAHFPSIDRKLVPSALPYMVRRTLQDGMDDLQEIALHEYHLFDRVSQGIWVFDKESSTWYCLGGKTELAQGAVRHTIVDYNIAELSSNPLIVVVHPQEFESWITPSFHEQEVREMAPGFDQYELLRNYRQGVGAFLAATPGRAEYVMVSRMLETALPDRTQFVIVSSVGFSRVVFPNDTSALEHMGQYGRDIRDEALLGFDWVTFQRDYGFFKSQEGMRNFLEYIGSGFDPRRKPRRLASRFLVSKLIDTLNTRLPSGFRIDFYLPDKGETEFTY